MKMNKWTVGLTALGVVSLASAVRAEEKMSTVQTALSATTLSGYVDTSAQYNPGPGAGQLVPGYYLNDSRYANGFNLDVVALNIEKKLTDAEWVAGYAVDLWMGPQANQLGTTSTFGGPTSDFAIKQAYVALRVPVGTGLTMKLGVFDSPLGYESVASVGSDGVLKNPNFTRSYGCTMEPSTFTGLLASYQVVEMVKITAGIADTYGSQINQRIADQTASNASGVTKPASFLTYMGAVEVTAPESTGFLEGSKLWAGIVNGFNSSTPANAAGVQADQTSFYVGATVNTPIKQLTAGVAYDYVSVNAQPLTWDNSGYANAVAGYLSFKATEKMSLHGRAEYATHGGPSVNGLPNRVLGLTGTVQYDLWLNVITRLEARFDRNLNGPDSSNPAGGNVYGWDPNAGAFGSATSQNAFMLALNVIYKF
jgi:hypothetical protein